MKNDGEALALCDNPKDRGTIVAQGGGKVIEMGCSTGEDLSHMYVYVSLCVCVCVCACV